MREFGKIITRKTDLTDAQVQEKYKFPAIIILHDNEDHIVKITHYQKNGTKTIYDFSLSASKQFVTDSIATAIAGLQDNRLEFNAFSDFPAIGDETKFYIDLSEDKIYIWDSNSQTYKNQSWDTATMGSRSQQLSLSSIFRVNQDGNANKVDVTAGVLFSQTLEKTWNVSALITTLPDNDYRYVYARASKTTLTASIYLSKNQIPFDSDVNDYYFLVGILHSVVDGVRVLSITVGTTTISGGLVRTGIISSLDGQTSFNLNTGEIKGKITFSSGSSGYENLTDKPDLSSFEQTRDYVNSTLQTDLADLKNRADGVIESWFYSHTPTLSNLPASNWVTTEERNAHIGDTFTNMQEFVDNVTTPDAGKAWRFVKNETTGEFSWSLIANSDSTKALIEAGKAKDTADAKRRVFVSQPYPPYNVGDLWVQGNGGDIMRCKFERLSGSYVATDFEKASKYTDDTAVNNLQIGGRNLVLNSQNEVSNNVSSDLYIVVYSGSKIPLEVGVYTLQLKMKIDDSTGFGNSKFYFYAELRNGLIYTEYYNETICTEKDGKYRVYSTKLTVTVKGSVQIFALVYNPEFKIIPANIYFVKEVKLEKGNKATDWTPAPEDVDSAISTAQNSANTANNLLSDIANDNILTPSEKQSTKKEWDIIVGEKAVVESQANTLGVSTTSYVNAYNSLNSYITPLLADLTVNSVIVGVDFRATFKNYYDSKIALLKAVTDKLKSNTDNIQIGGRNLMLNSKKAPIQSGNGTSLNLLAGGFQLTDATEYQKWETSQIPQGQLILSFKIHRVEGVGDGRNIRFYNGSAYEEIPNTSVIDGEKIVTHAFNNTGSINGFYMTFLTGRVEISWMKLEKGNKATDWTPAPEDVVAEYTALVNQEIADVKGDIAGLETTINGAFKDGIIEEAEARAIGKYINSLNAEKADLSAKYTATYNDVNLTDKSALQSAWSNYDASHGQLITSINTAISDGRATVSDRQDVDLKFADYKNKLAALSTSFENAFKAIEQKKIDGIQIGGRNLILNSELKGVISGLPSLDLSEPIIAGQEYTLSFTAKKENPNSGVGWVSVQRVNDWTAEQLNVRVSVTDSEYKEYKATFIAKSTAIDQKIWVYSHDYYKIDFKKGIKLEKGNKATDWTPAPEDIQLQIDVESAKVINLEHKTDFLTGTTIEGNAIATGTLLVGNSDGTNAGITGLGSTTDGVYLWGGGTYQQMVQGLAKKEQRRNGIDIWRHPNGQIGFEIGIKDGRLIFNGYHSSGFKLFELDPNRGLIAVAYSQESWTETPFRKLNYSSSTFDESTITNEIKLAIIKQSKMEYYTPPPHTPDSEFGYTTTYNLSQNAVGYDYDNGTNPANSSYESLKGMKANYGDRNTNMSNGWYVSSIGEIHMETEWNSYPPMTYTFTVYVYYYQDGKITQTKVVTVTK